jgi:predicted nucleotidyltransferase
MHPSIAQHLSGIAALCKQHQVARLQVFGSAARADDFDPATSDADFLVEFDAGARTGLSQFFAVQQALAQLLGREVDLVETGAVNNPFVLADIERCRELVYAA